MSAGLLRQVSHALLPDPPKKLGVAVSGGSDSLGLLVMLHQLARVQGFALSAATVDHGLRPEAATEAADVAALCQKLDVPHDVLLWQDWDRKGNLQDAARRARYALLGDWGRARSLDAIALGHTQDDLAETFVMRLARQAGVDGLSAMSNRFDRDGAIFMRPLLGLRRTDIQAYLTEQGVSWVCDPSNGDDRFDRARIRKALAILADLGLEADRLAAVAHHMAEARTALDAQMMDLARAHVSLKAGAVAIGGEALSSAPMEARRRLMAHALAWVSGAGYTPRGSALTQTIATLKDAPGATLQGCELRWRRGVLWIYREFQSVTHLRAPVSELWDGRWRLTHATPPEGEYHIAPLGPEGLKTCPDWRDLDLPRGVLLSSPAIWRGNACCAAPLAGRAENWQARLERGEDEFFAAHMTH